MGKNRRSPTSRRSVLVTLATGASLGLAGCSGGGGQAESTDPPQESTDLPDEVEEEIPDEEGGRQNSIIPGEVVHDELDGLEVLDHWAEQDQRDWVKVELQNNRDETFAQPSSGSADKGDDIVRARTLTEQGNELNSGYWFGRTTFGPDEINPGTSAVIGLSLDPAAENAARYEICLQTVTRRVSLKPWEEVCS